MDCLFFEGYTSFNTPLVFVSILAQVLVFFVCLYPSIQLMLSQAILGSGIPSCWFVNMHLLTNS